MKFVHAADLHLDAPFRGVSALDSQRPHVVEALRGAAYRAFDRLVGLCLEEKADFLVIAGDSFDRDEQSLRAQLAFADGLRRLGEAGVPSYVVRGNHDPLSGWSPAVEHHPAVTVFGEDLSERLVEGPDSKAIARIVGRSYPERASEENPTSAYTVERRAGLYTIGVLHASVGDAPGHSPYAPCSVRELAGTGLDYVALGHIHAHGVLHRDPWIVYPGCIQGRHIREAGPKGCCVITVEGGRTDARFVALDEVRWATASVDVSGVDDLTVVRDRAAETLSGIQEDADGRSVCVRMTLEGRTDLDAQLRGRDVATQLREELREEFAAAAPFAWIEELRLATRPPADLEARAEQNDLLGLALRKGRELEAEPRAVREALAELLDHHTAGRLIAEPDEDELRELLRDASLLLYDQLEGLGS